MSNDIDLKVLEGLSEEEKQAALKILEQFAATGSSDLLDDLKYADFEEIPVTIDEFIDGPQFLRSQLWEKDIMTGKETCKFFPYWRKTLNRLFPDNLTTAYNTLVLTGGIGLGKTLAGIVAVLYLLYRMLCLKDPYQYYGMIKNDKITFSMLNVTLDAAKGVAWDKLQNFLQGSPWFMSHGQMNASRSNPQWAPPKGIELIFGSNNRHVVGRALFCLTGDTEIATVDGDFRLDELVNKDIQVISVDDNGQQVISNTCSVQPTVKSNEIFEIELEDGSILKCTPNHRFMLKDGTYKEAQFLTEDDEIAEGIV